MAKCSHKYKVVLETRKCLDSRPQRPDPLPPYEKEVETSLYGKAKREILNGKWRCNLKVETLATLSLEQAAILIDFQRREDCSDPWYNFAAPDFLLVELTYPLSKIHEFTLRPMKVESYVDGVHQLTSYRFEPGYLLWMIAREYLYIYKNDEQYGVWGHGIGDLFIESIAIDTNGLVDVGIGS